MKLRWPFLALFLAACAAPPPVGEVPGSVAEPEYHMGDSWTYRVRDGYNGLTLRTLREEVSSLAQDRVSMRISGDGLVAGETETYTREGNPVDIRVARTTLRIQYAQFNPAYAFPLEVGKRWRQDFVIRDQVTRRNVRASLYAQVTGWEHIAVPAGEFDALKIRRQIYLDDEEFWRWGTEIDEIDWYVPSIKRFAKREDKSEYREKSGRWPNNIRRGDWTIVELAAYRQ